MSVFPKKTIGKIFVSVNMKRIFKTGLVFLVSGFGFLGCGFDSDPFTGIKIVSVSIAAPGETISVKATYYDEDNADTSKNITYVLSDDATEGANFGTSGSATVLSVSATSGTAVNLTLGSEGSTTTVRNSVTVTASCDGYSASKTIYTSITCYPWDVPTGYAGVGFTSFYDPSKVVTVNTKDNLVYYAEKGGYTIFVDGMIDMSEGMLPSTGGGSTSALDAFVASNSSYSTYSAYNKGELAKVSSSSDKKNDLNSAYSSVIRLNVASNTAIIGKSSNCGIKGGSIVISGRENVIIRNLVVQNAYDPFPNHEAGDGWNAQQDNIAVRSSKNVWIDYCTLEDTLQLVYGPNGEKWQTYDGLCDITVGSTYVTVSNCILRNHDKTMLIGSGSSDTSGGYVTLSGNYFYNCGQRLPLTAYKNMHIYNNAYVYDGGWCYSQQYAIGARYSAYTIIAEKNYFSGISSAFKASTNALGACYVSGNSTTSGSLATTSVKPFDVPYSYSIVSAGEAYELASSLAGAGVITVQ
ncbi:MAG: polysaccharide lyase family 1 protein [Treponema sp.]|nr:polysaccharide lyase family 1 protein [Treponema sp.]